MDTSGHETVEYGFPFESDGANTYGGLAIDAGGNLYGTANIGGVANQGIVYKIDPAGNETALYEFRGTPDGGLPYAGVTLDSTGNLYGTTQRGGTANAGTVYKLDPAGNETVLYSFQNGTDGGFPQTGVVIDASGNLYGITQNGSGLVYKLDQVGHETVLYNFVGPDYPNSGLALDPVGNLYGTSGDGVYELNTAGQRTLLGNFGGGTGGPEYGVTLDGNGNLYGTTVDYSVGFMGVVYKLDPAGNVTVLSSLQEGLTSGGLIRDSAGNLYGTIGGNARTGSGGAVFKVDPAGKWTELYNFPFWSEPSYGVVRDAAGNFYGTSSTGGTNYTGMVYKLANAPVSITSSPSGAAVTVAGSGCVTGGYTTPVNVPWGVGGVCTVSFTDPQIIGGPEYEFQSSTVNGSAVSHTNPISVSFSGGTLSINAVFSAVGTTTQGTATHFSVSAPSTATAGIPIQFTVTALNASNQTATTYTDPVHFTSTDPAATLPADAALTNGVGTFSASLVTPGTATLTASDLLSSSITGTSGSIAVSQSTSGLRFVSMPPCRLVDTRDATKPSGFGPPSLVGEASRSFTLPNGPCDIPPYALAQAYSLNVTVVPHGELGYLTVWPTGQSQPLASTLNSLDGEVQANAAIVAGGTGGAISVLATNNTDLVLDINGYFVLPNAVPGELGFYPMTPCRLVDTRPGAQSTIITGALVGGTSTTLPILSGTYTGSSPLPCDVPSTARAYSLNFTLVPTGPVGYLTVYPTGEDLPIVSTLNDPTGAVQANAAIAPAGTGGNIEAFVTQTTNLVVDINGYFAQVGAGPLSLYTLPPCRVLDTRNPPGAPPFEGTINVNVLGSGCGGTSAAEAYVFNATVVPDGLLGYLTLWPEESVQPLISTLNAYAGDVTSNMAIVSTSDTEISAFATNNTYLVLDIFGYFAP